MHLSSFTSLFSNRNYAIFVSGNLISLTGNWVQIVAVAWLTWEMTGSTLWLGIMAMAQVVPFVLVTPWAGVLADRYERRKIIFLSQSGACLTALTLFALYELGILTIGVLFAVLAGLVAWFWFDSQALGVVIALAMIINLVVAGLAGTTIPLILDRSGIDPAVASSVFLTTITDVVGFAAFLGLAAWLLL